MKINKFVFLILFFTALLVGGVLWYVSGGSKLLNSSSFFKNVKYQTKLIQFNDQKQFALDLTIFNSNITFPGPTDGYSARLKNLMLLDVIDPTATTPKELVLGVKNNKTGRVEIYRLYDFNGCSIQKLYGTTVTYNHRILSNEDIGKWLDLLVIGFRSLGDVNQAVVTDDACKAAYGKFESTTPEDLQATLKTRKPEGQVNDWRQKVVVYGLKE